MRNCSIRVANIKALISNAVSAQLICALVFGKSNIRFSHDAAHYYYYHEIRLEHVE